jgi:hypothetical protein
MTSLQTQLKYIYTAKHCTDINDVNFALNELRQLYKLYPNSKIIVKKINALLNKLDKLNNKSIYKFKVGDKVEWVGRFTKKKFDCIVKNVNRKDNLIRIVADKEAENPLIYLNYYVEPEELNLKKIHKINK